MFALVVVNYDSHSLLADNVANQPWAEHGIEVVVVDNYHSAGARDAVVELGKQQGWHVETPPGNTGFGGGVNRGAAWALARGAQVVVTVNPDVQISAESVAEVAKHAQTHTTQVTSARIMRPDGRPWFRGAMLDVVCGTTSASTKWVGDKQIGVPWVTGAVMACHSDFWQSLGGFDEDYFMYWEDVDLSYRAWRAGGSVAVLDHVTAVHDPGGTQGGASGVKSPLYIQYNCRNRLLFAAKHLSPFMVKRWRASARCYAHEVVLRSGSKKYLAHPPSVMAAVQGTRQGLAATGGLWLRSARR